MLNESLVTPKTRKTGVNSNFLNRMQAKDQRLKYAHKLLIMSTCCQNVAIDEKPADSDISKIKLRIG